MTSALVGYKTQSELSTFTDQVVPGQFRASEAPTISGTAQVDQVLTAKPGTWTPAGKLHLQWLADGVPIAGATGTTYDVTPADLRKVISLQVKVTQVGYTDALASSENTQPVAPGTFLNTREPGVVGTAQVGVPLTADKGAWTPKASVAYQWVVGGTEVPDATSKSFTPRPQDLGQPVTVEIMASRPGYLTALVTSQATVATLPGVFHATGAPEITGRPMVGHTLRASSGSWSLEGVTLSYQWYAGATPIQGATEASYQPTANEAGQPVHVVVTASAAGYTSESAASTDTDRVLLGVADLAKPTITGKAVLGRTLTAHVATFSPASATPYYRWMRGHSEPIPGAHAATYAIRRGDVGHFVNVQVTMRARNWVSATRRSAGSARVLTVPVLHVHTSIRNGRVFLRLRVVSPGLAAAPVGWARVLWHDAQVGRFLVADGRGSRLLAPMRAGTHPITVVYRGGAMETIGRITVRRSPSLSSAQSTSNLMPAAWRRPVRWSPIAWAVVTWPAVGGLSSKARQSADSASIFAVSS